MILHEMQENAVICACSYTWQPGACHASIHDSHGLLLQHWPLCHSINVQYTFIIVGFVVMPLFTIDLWCLIWQPKLIVLRLCCLIFLKMRFVKDFCFILCFIVYKICNCFIVQVAFLPAMVVVMNQSFMDFVASNLRAITTKFRANK